MHWGRANTNSKVKSDAVRSSLSPSCCYLKVGVRFLFFLRMLWICVLDTVCAKVCRILPELFPNKDFDSWA